MIGCSTAYQLLRLKPKLSILLLEKESVPAFHQTGHNSGVIHSGIYYKPGSYKAQNCIKGYNLLLDFCYERNIPFQKIGKLIVATKNEEIATLEKIYGYGIANGLKDLQLLVPEQIKEIEPNLSVVKAILVPQSAIIDYKEVVRQLLRSGLDNGLSFEKNKNVVSINRTSNAIRINCEDQSYYETNFLINCAGLQSDRIARLSGLNHPYRIVPFKGIYFKLNEEKKDIVKKLIYPVPDMKFPFLGIHYTRTIQGDQTLGPNAVLSFDREGYEASQFKWNDTFDFLSFIGFWKLIYKHWKTGLSEYRRNYSKSFFAAKASEMTPGIVAEDLSYAGSGIRAQVVDHHGNLVEDFLHHRIDNMIHICNAPSPAATAGLSIGDQIAQWYIEQSK